jgi:hypothetical protein
LFVVVGGGTVAIMSGGVVFGPEHGHQAPAVPIGAPHLTSERGAGQAPAGGAMVLLVDLPRACLDVRFRSDMSAAVGRMRPATRSTDPLGPAGEAGWGQDAANAAAPVDVGQVARGRLPSPVGVNRWCQPPPSLATIGPGSPRPAASCS